MINQRIEELMQTKGNIDSFYKFSIDVHNANEELQLDTKLNFSEKMALVDKFNKHYEDTNLKKMHVSCDIGEWQKLFGKNSLSDNEIEKIKVSIVLPIHNKAHHGLARGIESCLNQTHKNIEVICVNDASTDSSLEIIKEYAKKDDRLVIVDLKENRKCSGARIVGWEVATGDYITNVDPDDYIDNNYVKETLIHAIELNIDVLEVSSPVPKNAIFHYGAIGEIIFNENWNKGPISVNVWGKVYKDSLIQQTLNVLKKLNGINMSEDALLNAVIFEKANSIAFININSQYHYEPTEDSLTNLKDFSKIIKDVLYTYSITKNIYNNFYVDKVFYNYISMFTGNNALSKFDTSEIGICNINNFVASLDKEAMATMLIFSNIDLINTRLELRRLKKYKLDKIPKIVEKLFPYNSIQRNFGKLLYKLALSCYNAVKRAK